MTADSPQSHQSIDGANSPQNRKSFPSPWAQIVRGESESTVSAVVNQAPLPSTSPSSSATEQSNFSDCSPVMVASSPFEIPVAAAADCAVGNDENAGRPNKPAWKKPLNGVSEVSPVMGAVSWPALSDSTKFSPKSSPSADYSPKIVVSDGSVPSPKGPVRPHSPHKQGSSNAKSNATSKNAVPTRQRSTTRGGGSGGGYTQGNFSHPPPPPLPPPPPPFPLFMRPPNNMVPPMLDQSPREPSYRGNSWDPRSVGGFVPLPSAVNDNRHSPRRSNFRPRGEHSHHNNFRGRRDQDRGHYGNVRDVPGQPQRSPRGFVRTPPLNNATFVPVQPVRPPYDLVYVPGLPMEPFGGMPFIAHGPPAVIAPVPIPVPVPGSEPEPEPEPPLPAKLLHQIEYYFSDANLIRDEFLKSNMDDQGWVPVALIAGFNRVKSMTNDIQLILDSLTSSVVLEVQDENVRRRGNWMRWIPSSSRFPVDSNSQAFSPSSQDMLATSLQNMTMEEATANQSRSIVEPLKNEE